MRKLLLGLLVAAFLALLLVGCEKVTEVTLSDEDEIGRLIAELIWFSSTGYYHREDTTSTLGNPITPIFWWREADGDPAFGLEIQVNSERDSAFVTLTLHISGTLHNIADTGMGIDTVDKPLNDIATRYAIFLKDTVETYHQGWRLYKISGVEVVSDTVTVAIDSVTIVSSRYPHTSLTDPLALFLLDDALKFTQGEGVSLWVYANDGTADVYFHLWRETNWLRWGFRNEGGGVHFGVWTTPLEANVYHTGFDILQHETLWDDTYPYDSNVWLLPFVVE